MFNPQDRLRRSEKVESLKGFRVLPFGKTALVKSKI